MTSIYIDADACPVKDEVVRVAERHNIKVFIVSNGGLRPNLHPLVENIIVPDGPDIADIWIADRATKGDLVITGDIPLAAKTVASGARTIRHNGDMFTPANIGNQLATRDLMADLRGANPFFQGSGKPFGKADRSNFLNSLEREVCAAKREVL
ncbi:MAG: YaiI/YqxD family protein [Amylibacter sp.]|nr:YaiI/YqxD family protein [Amylibacter sp.]|tara:strand:+ start:4663 stop:5121 length:459 start_codon:yes stop_codon:yes gene_type:complete